MSTYITTGGLGGPYQITQGYGAPADFTVGDFLLESGSGLLLEDGATLLALETLAASAAGFVLLESGDDILLEDGLSRLLLEALLSVSPVATPDPSQAQWVRAGTIPDPSQGQWTFYP